MFTGKIISVVIIIIVITIRINRNKRILGCSSESQLVSLRQQKPGKPDQDQVQQDLSGSSTGQHPHPDLNSFKDGIMKIVQDIQTSLCHVLMCCGRSQPD